MTADQIELLEDKLRLWQDAAKYGNMEYRDYNRRAAEALSAALDLVRPTERPSAY